MGDESTEALAAGLSLAARDAVPRSVTEAEAEPAREALAWGVAEALPDTEGKVEGEL